MSGTWLIVPPSQGLFEEIDGFLACYSFSTGQTHILDAFPAEVLSLLACGPKSSAQIGADLAKQMGDESDAWFTEVDAVLRELQFIRLVDFRP